MQNYNNCLLKTNKTISITNERQWKNRNIYQINLTFTHSGIDTFQQIFFSQIISFILFLDQFNWLLLS